MNEPCLLILKIIVVSNWRRSPLLCLLVTNLYFGNFSILIISNLPTLETWSLNPRLIPAPINISFA